MCIEELRIGNYVEYNGCTGVVYAVHSPIPCDDEHFRDIGIVELVLGGIVTVRIDEIQPITLTEDLFLKCGFIKDSTNNTIWMDMQTHYLEFNAMPDGFYPTHAQYAEISIEIEQRVSLNKITNLHQLQNIIYSLTGQELEIKK